MEIKEALKAVTDFITGKTEEPAPATKEEPVSEMANLAAELASIKESIAAMETTSKETGTPEQPADNTTNELAELEALKKEINEAKQTIATLKEKNLELSVHGNVGTNLSPEKEMDRVFLEQFTPLTTEQVAKLIK